MCGDIRCVCTSCSNTDSIVCHCKFRTVRPRQWRMGDHGRELVCMCVSLCMCVCGSNRIMIGSVVSNQFELWLRSTQCIFQVCALGIKSEFIFRNDKDATDTATTTDRRTDRHYLHILQGYIITYFERSYRCSSLRRLTCILANYPCTRRPEALGHREYWMRRRI